MKTLKITALAAIAILALFFIASISPGIASGSARTQAAHGDGFAVLELFTSEGCSSCPPADELVARIQREAGNKPVYVLSYHVDYWNRLGWRDVFSQSQFSKRQYWYNRLFTGQVYTPQLIINGKTEFVGSDRAAILPAIKNALDGQSSVTLNLNAEQQGNKFKVSYRANGAPSGSQILLAVVQKHAVSKVSKGENEGRTLSHVQIVHNLYAFNLTASKQGSQQIEIPAAYNTNGWEVIGLLQDPQTGVINGAARATIAAL